MAENKTLKHLIRPLYPLPTPLNPKGKLPEKIKCVLFDIYGTMLISDSGDIGTAKKNKEENHSLGKLLKKYQIPLAPDTLLDSLFSEIRRSHERSRKKGINYPEVEIREIWRAVLGNGNSKIIPPFATEFEMMANPVYPMPHLKETLRDLNKNKTLLGIISNAQFYTPRLFNLLLGKTPENLGFRPELTLYSYKTGHAKPSMQMFQMAQKRLRHMGISPGEVMYVGNDMKKDILPASKTGFFTVLFAGDSRSLRLRQNDESLKALGPDMVITGLEQLIRE